MQNLGARWQRFIPRRLAQTLTVKPDRLDGSVMSGNSRFLKLKRSSMPGKIPKLGVLMDSLISMSSCVFATWYIWLKCSGWYLHNKMMDSMLVMAISNLNAFALKHVVRSCKKVIVNADLSTRTQAATSV